MARDVPEWIGKDDSTPVPPRVKLRVAKRANYTCQICSLGAKPGDADHTVALILGGQNREANLRWVCIPCHKVKTAGDISAKSRAAKTQKRMALASRGQTPWSKKLEAMKEHYEYDWTLKRYVRRPPSDLEETR